MRELETVQDNYQKSIASATLKGDNVEAKKLNWLFTEDIKHYIQKLTDNLETMIVEWDALRTRRDETATSNT